MHSLKTIFFELQLPYVAWKPEGRRRAETGRQTENWDKADKVMLCFIVVTGYLFPSDPFSTSEEVKFASCQLSRGPSNLGVE